MHVFYKKRISKPMFGTTSSVRLFCGPAWPAQPPQHPYGLPWGILGSVWPPPGVGSSESAWENTWQFTTSWDLDLSILKSDQMSGFLTASDGYIHCFLPPVVVLHYRKCIRTITRGVVGAMMVKRERRTSAQQMLYQKWILKHVFFKKHAFFGHGFLFRARFGGVREAG